MQIRRIVIVGCGQMGSRHLQAIVKLGGQLNIQVVEHNPANQYLAQKRLQEVLTSGQPVEIKWYKDIAELDSRPDLTIVATKAAGRVNILKELAKMGHNRFLIEKMVCQSLEEYDNLLETFENLKIKAWVNCTRSYFPVYERAIELMKNDGELIFNAMAGNLGLGCNSIHLLNLFLTMTGDPQDVHLDGHSLFPALLPNKRGKKLVEFAGNITAETSNQSFATISFHRHNNSQVFINAMSKNWRLFVDEGNCKALLAAKKTDWQWEELEFKIRYSSELSTEIANSIMEEKNCKLPNIQDCYYIHKELFKIFNEHIKSISDEDVAVCPIT